MEEKDEAKIVKISKDKIYRFKDEEKYPPKKKPEPKKEMTFQERIKYLQLTIGNQAVAELLEAGPVQGLLSEGRPKEWYEKEADRIAKNIVKNNPVVKGKNAEINELKRTGYKFNDNGKGYNVPAFYDEIWDYFNHNPIAMHSYAANLAEKNGIKFNGSLTDEYIINTYGNPLEEKTKQMLEPHLNVNLDDVRIHKDKKANEMAESMNARAFTVGNDIYFNRDEYNPDSAEGKELIAHEVVHTIQQDGAVQTVQMKEDVISLLTGIRIGDHLNEEFLI